MIGERLFLQEPARGGVGSGVEPPDYRSKSEGQFPDYVQLCYSKIKSVVVLPS